MTLVVGLLTWQLMEIIILFSMEGGELFTSIQDRADNAFTERG